MYMLEGHDVHVRAWCFSWEGYRVGKVKVWHEYGVVENECVTRRTSWICHGG